MLRRIRQAQLLMDNACMKYGKTIRIMEVCGSHTLSLFRNAIRESIPHSIKILTGPGCSVCAVDPAYFEQLYMLADNPNNILAMRSELMNVPVRGIKISDLSGVITVSSVLEALDLSRIHPDKTVVYAGLGFETCTPGAAVAIELAGKEQIQNFCILSSFKLMTTAIRSLLLEKNHNIDAFMCCGNMVTVSGYGEYEKITEEFNVPCLPVGFEPMQLIEGLAEICRQLTENKPKPIFKFAVGASYEGNTEAQKYIAKYFETVDSYWRGLGKIEKSSLVLRDEYAHFDAYKKFGITKKAIEDISGCRCGEVVCGLIEPPDCKMFGTDCCRTTPVGPCMASTEGACNVWARYNRRKRI